MSLKKLAEQTGRNGDDHLVHMSGEEVNTLHGLAALNGTRLTTNPHTGLPEAFNLGGLFRTVLPIAAGVAGSAMGMPWLGALAAGAMTTAQTGDLGKGLASGLGSYALGNLGSAALGQGAANLASGTADAATQAGTQAASDIATQGSDLAAQSAAAQGMGSGAAMGPGIGAAESLGKSFPNLSADQISQVTSEGTPDLMAQRASMLNSFGPNTYQQPSAMDKLGALSLSDVGNIAKANPGSVMGAGTMLLNSMTPQQQTGPTGGGIGDLANLSKAKVVPDYYTRNQRQFASGGLASLDPKSGPGANTAGMMTNAMTQGFPQQNVQSPMYAQPTQMPMERAVLHSGYSQMTDPNTGDQMFAEGGLASLASMAGGGMAVRGAGDGTSDSVPAMIGGVEPARIADGEYVLSADTVSHIGNGSTEAGVKKLDQMMARIRKARTGSSKIAPTVKAEKYLPA